MANDIHPTAIIADSVELGDGNVVGPYAVISGRTVIGDGNWIGPHVAIGMPPEVYNYEHTAVWNEPERERFVRIGNGNVLHEFSNVQCGWATDTVIGNDCFLMTQAHVAHDCVLDNRVTVSSGVTLGGHTHIWSMANVGMSSVVHQRAQIGPGAMIGMGSAVRKDAPAFSITVGNPARTTGINVVGLERNGCDATTIDAMTDFLLGRGELPASAPEALRELLTAWADRPTDH